MADIVVVEDESAIQSLIAMNLTRAGFTVRQALNAAQAQAEMRAVLPDLVILDWMLPDRSGLELARLWRSEARSSKIPILMLTARSEEEDIVRALDAGADDYLTKPFSPKELLARMRALLRRSAPEATTVPVQHGTLCLDPATHQVTSAGAAVKLSPIEFRLLHFFMKQPNVVHSRTKLLDTVWGDHVYIEERTVDVHIRRLRSALVPHHCEEMIDTIRGGGYRFIGR
jgi:two-component system, OmpR family, phosphate regulon response regulator PhoB